MRFTLPRRSGLTRERGSLAVFLLLACTLAPRTAAAQQLPAGTLPVPTPAAAALLQRGLAALTGGVQITDVTLTGTASVPNHPGASTGSIVLVATAGGRSQVTLTSSTGVDTEINDYSAGPHSENYSGPDGVIHKTPPQSLPAIHPAWFFPAFIIAAGSSSAGFAASEVGQETRNGIAVRHLTLWHSLSPHGSQHDLYFDPASMLPTDMVFRIRAFNPNNPDAPLRAIPTAPAEVEEEVRYSDYRPVQGVPVPFHIQFYIRGALAIDIQVSSATINTGATIAALN